MKHPNLNEEKKLWKKGYRMVAGIDEAGRGPLAGPVVAAAVVLGNSKSEILISNKNPKSKCQMPNKIQNSKSKFQIYGVNDSKKLSAKRREKIYKILINNLNIGWGIGVVSEKIIDKINILEATKLAMQKAIKNLEKKLTKNKFAEKNKNFDTFYQYDRIDKKYRYGYFEKIDYILIDGNFGINPPTYCSRAVSGGINIKIPQKSIIKGDQKVFSIAAASIIAKVYRDNLMQKFHKKYPLYGFAIHKGYPTLFHRQMLKKYGPCKIHRKTFGPVREIV